MRTALPLLAAVLFAAPASAQPRVDANAGAVSVTPGTQAGASVTGAGTNSTGVGAAVTPLTSAPGLGSAPGAFSAPSAAAPSPAAPAAAAPTAAAAAPAPGARFTARPSAVPAEVPAPALTRQAAALSGSPTAAAAEKASRAPSAGATLGGAAHGVGAAARVEAVGAGDGLSVSRALDGVFDAAAARSGLRETAAGGVAGAAQSVRAAVAQKVGIANTASPADAPGLYQDAIKTAKDALPAPVAEGVAAVVRRFAERKAEASLGDLAAGAYRSAASGSAAETSRQLGAFDKWEALLGSPSRPLVSNLSALKSDVGALLAKAAAGAAASVPHVWFAKKGGAYVAVLPGAGVAAVPALAASFAIAPAALAPATPLADAYRAFAADPRAGTGAGLVYRARRALGSSVPAAAWSASSFWLKTMLVSLWRRVVAFLSGARPYALADKAGQDSLRADLSVEAAARTEAADAARRLSATVVTVADARAAFAAASRAAEALRGLTGEGDAVEAVAALSRSFEAAAAARRLAPDAEVPSALSDLLVGPGALAHWAARVGDEAGRAVDARFWRSRAAGDFVNLGSALGPAVSAAAQARTLAGAARAAFVVRDERLWARGRGDDGEARLSADLRAAGSVELSVDRAGAGLGRRLEDLGFTVVPEGRGLRASIGAEDFSRAPAELGLVAARALAAALGAEAPAVPGELKALADAARRDPAGASALAARLDGRQAFARAPVIGLVGEYEALGPTPVVLDGKALTVTALRDPDTGLLSYARAVPAVPAVAR